MTEPFMQLIKTQRYRQPHATAIKADNTDVSYEGLWNAAVELRDQFQAMGVQCIAVAMPNCAAWIALDLAAVMAGVIFVPVPHFFSHTLLEHLIQGASIDLLVSGAGLDDSPLAGQVQPCLGSKLLLKTLAQQTPSSRPVAKDALKISYTSGTTGNPRGVLVSSSLVNRTVHSLLKIIGQESAKRHLSVLPFSLLLENIVGIYAVLAAGGCCLVPDFKTLGISGSSDVAWGKFAKTVNDTQPSSMITVPALLQGLLHCVANYGLNVQSLKFVAVGGAPISTTVLDRAKALGLPVFQGYGMTECGSVVCINTPAENQIGSVGKPLPHVSMRIDEQGQIVIQGVDFLGYANQSDSGKEQEWPSGDLGYIDDAGFIHVTGRIQSSYSTAYGRNVAPEWVESELESEMIIAQSSVFGAGHNHNVAVIVPAISTLKDEHLASIIAQVNQRLPDYARVKWWVRANQPFSPANGQRSVSGSLRREQIYSDYQDSIEPLFTGTLS